MNFEHGDLVTIGDAVARVHAPRWWNVVAHVRWIVARLRSRTMTMSLSTGETMRLVR